MSNSRNKTTQHKNIKKEILFADVGLIVLGALMIIMPYQSNTIICTIGGILIGLWGLFKLVLYFNSDQKTPFSSFGLVPGTTAIVIAFILIASNNIVAETIIKVLAFILIISAIMKIQYTVDFVQLKAKQWFVPLLGAAVSLTSGILVLFEVFNYANAGVWRFLGASFVVSCIWDAVSIILISNIKNDTNQKNDD